MSLSFDGTADYSLDSKNRLTVPARFRKQLDAGGLVLAKGIEPCVALWTRDAYDAYRRSALVGVHPMSARATKIKRFFSANSQPADLDSAGRVALPPFLVDHAGLMKDVTVIGADDHLEIWDRQAWTQYNQELSADVLAIAEGFDEVAP